MGVGQHLPAVEVAEVDVHVPVTLVDGDHLGADVAADDPGRGGEGLAEVRPAVGRAVVGVAGAGVMSRVAWRVDRTRRAHRAVVLVPQRVQRAASLAGGLGVPLVVGGDRGVVQRADRHQRHRAGQLGGWRAVHDADALQRRAVGVACRPAGSASRPGRWSPGGPPRPPPSPRSASGWPSSGRWRGRPPACRRSRAGAAARARGAGRRSRRWCRRGAGPAVRRWSAAPSSSRGRRTARPATARRRRRAARAPRAPTTRGVGDEAEADTAEPTMKVAPRQGRGAAQHAAPAHRGELGQQAPSGRGVASGRQGHGVTAGGSRESRRRWSAAGGTATASPGGPGRSARAAWTRRPRDTPAAACRSACRWRIRCAMWSTSWSNLVVGLGSHALGVG